MKKLANRGLALLMAFVMIFSLMPVMEHTAHAATVNYVYSTDGNNYIYNWGSRGTTATFLSPNAENFYTGNYTYENLSQLSRGTSTATAPSSDLYKALQDLMESNHSYETSYNATKDLYQYTDCQNSGGKISSFYSGAAIGPAWGSAPTWNREHTWPNSKGLGGNDENDIMMLRPTAQTENSSRGNMAYGESGGYYHPNSESDGKYDLRGDVARIFLYVYVRWDNVNGNGEYSTWGSRGVIESQEVLLNWMAADPVDTWELGRNDSVESITGTRNVFVDYPELAFLLFGEEVPADMITPSGIGSGSSTGHKHNYTMTVTTAPTCTADGACTYTCECGSNYAGVIEATGHSYANGACSICGAKEPAGFTATLVTSTADLSVGDQIVIVAKDYGYAMSTEQKTNNRNQTDITKSADGSSVTFTADSAVQIFTLKAGTKTGTYAFDAGNGYLFAASSSANYLKTSASLTDDASFAITITNGAAAVVAQGSITRNVMRYNESGLFSCYLANNTQKDIAIYEIGASCDHNFTSQTIAPTCTANGKEVFTCTICGGSYENPIASTGHSYVNGTCSACGTKEPTGSTVMIYYPAGNLYVTSTASGNKLASGTEAQAAKWVMSANENGYYSFVVDGKYLTSGTTGNSLSLTSTLTNCGLWEVIECQNGVYLRNIGATYQGTSNQYLEYYNNTFTTYGFKESNASIYTFQLKTVGSGETTECEHTWKDATCTAPKTCSKCGTTEGEALGHAWSVATCTAPKTCSKCGTTEGEKADHDYVNGKCSVCGDVKPSSGETEPVVTEASISFADKANRTEYSTTKQVWKQNGITVTNDKAASSSNVGDYSKPARFYAGSSLTIDYPGMTKIVIDCTGLDAKYVSAWNHTVSGATVVIANKIVTITLDAPVDAYTIAKLSAQARANSMTVYAEKVAEPECSHDWKDATCTAPKTCSKCGTTEGEALGHAWADATCTAPKTCSKCGTTEGEKADHNYVDGKCSVCDEADPNFKPDTAEPTTVSVTVANYATANGWTNSTKYLQMKLDDVVSVTVSGGSNTGKYYTSGNNWRIYQTETPKIVVSAGDKTIVSVKITYSVDKGGALTLNGTKVTSGTVVEVNAPSVTFGVGNTGTATNGQVRITAIEVVYIGAAVEPECSHDWKDATCTAPKTCSKCNATEGEALGHTWADATCTAPKTCSKCGTTEGEKADHNYVDGKCSVCDEADPNFKPDTAEPTTVSVTVANYAKANGWTNSTKYLQMKLDDVVSVTVSGKDNTGKYYTSGNNWRIYQTETPKIVVSAGDKTIVSVKITYSVDKGGALTLNGTKVTSGTVVEVNAPSVTFGVGNTGTATNGQVRITAIEVVYIGAAVEPECSHDWKDATCTAPKTCSKCNATEGEALGHTWADATCTAPKTCSKCGTTEGEKADHNYVDGKCSVCGDVKQPVITEAAISFADKANRTEYSTTKQVWKQNGITVTNTKAASTSNVGDYYKPARFYKSSDITIEFPGMTKIVIDCTGIDSKYVSAWNHTAAGTTVVIANNIVTITFDAPADTYTITKLGAQVRANSMTVYAEASGSGETPAECTHDWADATCTLPKTCSKCGTTEGEALGHTWADATCKAPKTCSKCDTTEGEKADHNYVDGKCSVCGEEKVEESTDTIVMIYYPAKNLYVTSTASGKRLAGGNKDQAAEWTMTVDENGYYSFVSGGQYLTSGAAGNEVYLSGTLTNCGLWEVIDCQNGVYLRNIGAAYNGTNNQYLEYYNGFTTYGFNNSNASVYTFRLENVTEGEGGETGCSHSYTSTVTIAPTCTVSGLVTYTCECGDSYSQTVAPTGHAYIGGKCVRCGSAAYVPPVVDIPEVIVPTSGNVNATQVEISVAGSKVTIQNIDLTEIGNTADESNTSVTIDLSGMNTDVSEVAIPADMFEKIADAAVDSTQNLEIVLSEGLAIEFNVAALGEQMKLAGGKDLTVSIIPSEEAVLTSKQQETVGQNIAYDINMTSGGKHISDMGGQITVSAPYELKDGEKASGLVVYYVDENGNRERCATYYDAETKSVKWNTNHLSLYMLEYDENSTEACDGSATCPVHAFTDAKTDAWYHDGVHYCVANGLMDGTSNNTFSPSGTATRAQIVTILWRLEGKPVVNYLMQFDDVASDSWYTEAVRWAAAEKIVEGHDGKFDPNGAITREQLATILYRYEQYKGGGFTGTWMFLLDCTDRDKVSSWAYEAMCWMSMNGVITGTDGALNPKNNATRAQIAMTLYRYCEVAGKED